MSWNELFAYDHEGYVERISKKAQWMVTMYSDEEIAEELEEIIWNKGRIEYDDLRDCILRYIKSGIPRYGV